MPLSPVTLFEPARGVWAAEDLAPRGGLLYVTWERMAVVAYRIIPDWLDGNLISARLFTISAFPDGTTQLSLVTGRGVDDEYPLELPGVLVWESPARAKFHLQTLLPPSARSPASIAAAPFARVPPSSVPGDLSSSSSRVSPATSLKSVVAGPSSSSLSSLSSLGAAARLKATFQRAGLGRFAATAVPASAIPPTATAVPHSAIPRGPAVTPPPVRAAVPTLPPRPPSSRSAGSNDDGTLLSRSGPSIGDAALHRAGFVCSTGKEGSSSKRLQLRALRYLTGLKRDSGSASKEAAAPSKRPRSGCDSTEASPDEARRLRSRVEPPRDTPITGSRDVALSHGAMRCSRPAHAIPTRAPPSAPRVDFSASAGSSAGASAAVSVPSASSAEWSLKRRSIGRASVRGRVTQPWRTPGAGGGEVGIGGSSSGKGVMRGWGEMCSGSRKGASSRQKRQTGRREECLCRNLLITEFLLRERL
ncbi:hypothetical protein CLOP_g24430 [Closterium sp. NIES-67]|nr:hypothetical protein CLOP_g24430 [Closterium sp. NIES-67]